MRKSVDFPAPLAPTTARTSPGFTSNEMPRKAGTVSRETGCSSARHPDAAGGKYFSTFSRLSARLFTNCRYILSNNVKQGPQVASHQLASEARCRETPEQLQFRALAAT